MGALRYFDVLLVVVAAPIMILIGVSADGYLIGGGAWIALRVVGELVERYAQSTGNMSRTVSVRLGFMLGRLFALALAVILARSDAGRNGGLAALVVIVVAFTVSLGSSAVSRISGSR